MQWKSILAVSAILVIAGASQAHVNATSEGPTDVVDPINGATASVTLFANCAVVLAEYDGDANGARSPLSLILAEPPSWLNFTGDDVPFTMANPANCDTDVEPTTACPCVFTTGNILIVPGPMAPAFEMFTLQPDAVNRHGGDETVQGGAFDITVGYYATVSQLGEGHVDLSDGSEYVLRLAVASNGATRLAFSVDAPDGITVAGLPDTLAVDSPLLDGNSTRIIEVPIQITGETVASNDTHDHHAAFMLGLTVTPIFDGPQAAPGTPFNTTLHVVPAEHGSEGEHGGEGAAEDTPGLPLVAAILALLWAARRR